MAFNKEINNPISAEELLNYTPIYLNRDGTPMQIPGQLFGVNFDRSLYDLPPPKPPISLDPPRPSFSESLGLSLNKDPPQYNSDGTPVQIPGQLFGVNFDRSLYDLPPLKPPAIMDPPRPPVTHFLGKPIKPTIYLYADGTPVEIQFQKGLFKVD